jgi:hypothetical protein
MKLKSLAIAVFIAFIATVPVFSQSTIVINTPNSEPSKAVLSAAEQALMDKEILPKARKKLAGDACNESIEIAAVTHGAFTKKGADQTLIFYQFCQTGNGLGSAGIALIENGAAIGNYVSAESGWTNNARTLPDINQNGLSEVALYYSGGMHQGQGGIGVDIMEFSAGALKGIGWYQAEGFTETTDNAYKVTVKPGPKPVFFRERWASMDDGNSYKKAGSAVPLKLKPVTGGFEALN